MFDIDPVRNPSAVQDKVKEAVKKAKYHHLMFCIVLPSLYLIAIIVDCMLQYMGWRNALGSFAVCIYGGIWLFIALGLTSECQRKYTDDLIEVYMQPKEYMQIVDFNQKYLISRRARLSAKIYRTESLVVLGRFEEAYKNQNELLPYYGKMSTGQQLNYDYCWVKLFDDMEDKENYTACMNVFKERWSKNPNVKKDFRYIASRMHTKMAYHEMMFAGDVTAARAFQVNLYRYNQIDTLREFIQYCYFMGQIEWTLDNLMLAKHWFAQAASFNLDVPMVRESAERVKRLEEMHVPYSLTPPSDNVIRYAREDTDCFKSNLFIATGLIILIAMVIL